jgi:hypothetical protein
MNVAERTFAIVSVIGLIRRIGGRADVQIMPATGLKAAQLRHSVLPGLKSGRGKSD